MIGETEIVYLSYGVDRSEADFVFRIGRPAQQLAALGYRVRVLELFSEDWPKAALTAPLLIVAMTWQGRVFEVLQKRKLAGLPTILQLDDDFLNLPDGSIGQKEFGQNPYFQDMILALLHGADAVQFSSAGLQNRYEFINPVNWIARNAVDPLPFVDRQFEQPWRIGLVFSLTHAADLEAAVPLLMEFHQLCPTAVVEVLCPKEISGPLQGKGNWLKHIEGVPYHQYLEITSRWHLLLVPQKSHAFNFSRSDSKWLDAARVGVPCLLPNALPYKDSVTFGSTAFSYDYLSDIPTRLMEILTQPDGLKSVARAAHSEVTLNRNWEIEMAQRLGLYQKHFNISVPNGDGHYQPDWTPGEIKTRALWEEFQQDLSEQISDKKLPTSLKICLAFLENSPGYFGLTESLYMTLKPLGLEGVLSKIPLGGFNMDWPDFLLNETQLAFPESLNKWPTPWAIAAARALAMKKTYEANKAVKTALNLNPYSLLALQVGYHLSTYSGSATRADGFLSTIKKISPELAAKLDSL